MRKIYNMKTIKKLNFGCGKDIKKGYVNLDIINLKGVDILHDINISPYPFKKEEFNEIYTKHVLEHVKDLSEVMKELHRILKPKGKIKIIVPYFTSIHAITDPTHRNLFAYYTFDLFLKSHDYHFYFNYGFAKLKKKITFDKKYAIWNHLIEFIANKWPIVYESTPLRMFPASELHVELIK